MRKTLVGFTCIVAAAVLQLAVAQAAAPGGAPAPAPVSPTKDDFKPSSLNQPGQQYPQVNSERFARFRVVAPNAQSVTVSLGLGGTSGGTKLTKGEDGAWTGTTAGPMEEGFHYYHLNVDGGTLNDPGTGKFLHGSTRWGRAASKSRPTIRISMPSRTCPTAM